MLRAMLLDLIVTWKPDLQGLHLDSAGKTTSNRKCDACKQQPTSMYDTRNVKKNCSIRKGTRSAESERFMRAHNASCAVA